MSLKTAGLEQIKPYPLYKLFEKLRRDYLKHSVIEEKVHIILRLIYQYYNHLLLDIS